MDSSDQSIVIRAEQSAADVAAIRAVIANAFTWDASRVAELVDALRSSWAWLPQFSLVAETHDQIVGQVLLTRALVDAPGRLVDVLTLGPLAVATEHQRRGLGRRLVKEALRLAHEAGEVAVLLEGSPDIYSRLGFRGACELGYGRPSVRIPERAFQVRELVELGPESRGRVVYPDAYWRLDCVGLR